MSFGSAESNAIGVKNASDVAVKLDRLADAIREIARGLKHLEADVQNLKRR